MSTAKGSQLYKCDSCDWQRTIDAARIEEDVSEHQTANRGHIVYRRLEAELAPKRRPIGWGWWVWLYFIAAGRVVTFQKTEEERLIWMAVFAIPPVVALIVLLMKDRHRVVAVAGKTIGIEGGGPSVERGFRRIAALVSASIFILSLAFIGRDVRGIVESVGLALVPWAVFYAGRWLVRGFAGEH